MEHLVITIGRQCGSGGHTIGKLLAQRLGLAFYDKKIVAFRFSETCQIQYFGFFFLNVCRRIQCL